MNKTNECAVAATAAVAVAFFVHRVHTNNFNESHLIRAIYFIDIDFNSIFILMRVQSSHGHKYTFVAVRKSENGAGRTESEMGIVISSQRGTEELVVFCHALRCTEFVYSMHLKTYIPFVIPSLVPLPCPRSLRLHIRSVIKFICFACPHSVIVILR